MPPEPGVHRAAAQATVIGGHETVCFLYPRPRAVMGQLSDMDLRLLQVFKAVVECGGMAAAELELNIGTSTVSRHVKDLETRLGMTLCRRGRAGFCADARGGQRVRGDAAPLGQRAGFLGSIDDIHARMGGQLAVAVFDKTASNPAARIHAAIAAFAEQAPDVQPAAACSQHQRHRARHHRRRLSGGHHPGAPQLAKP